MAPRSHEVTPLSVLGLTRADEELYRVLLRHTPVTYDALAELVDTAPRRLAEEVARLSARGLVVVRGDTVVAADPEETLQRLIRDETERLRSVQDQLEALRRHVPSLEAEHLAAQSLRGQPVRVELVEGGDVVQMVRALTAGSVGDLMWLRPDQWRVPEGSAIDAWVRELLRAGRRSRAIYPARVLEEAPEVVRQRAELGEHVRILAEVPGRLAIMRDSAALVPETFGKVDNRRLIVRQPSIISALTLLFESLWERAMTVPGLEAGEDAERVRDRQMLLDQLARGAKDEQIARSLGLSLRTVRRRVADVLTDLGATSRFQAGVEAVRRGWI